MWGARAKGSRFSLASHGFVLQKLWDPKIAAAPYLTALDTLLAGLVVKKQKRKSDAAR
jgi:hypothetical protein